VRSYEILDEKIEILAYCLMTNHFHLLVYQVDQGSLTSLMRRVMGSYSRYFNQKYRRSGALFETRFKASLITKDDYLAHITRYIHLNPTNWRDYAFSSLAEYRGARDQNWVKPARILELFSSPKRYLEFVEEYEDRKHELDDIKHLLANDV
jgi:putative transposase